MLVSFKSMLNFKQFPSQDTYLANFPFPHAVIRGAFEINDLLEIENEINNFTGWSGESAHQFAQKKRWCNTPERLGNRTRRMLEYLNSRAFLDQLEQLTGIVNLIPDPYLEGGGIHSISTGGYLGIHADFNFHPKLRLHRRINLILYLNSDWNEDWGGALELWSTHTQRCERKILPEINTMVVFNTTDTSLHGHPKPLACPESRRRNSIAMYYYSTSRPTSEISTPHSTQYYKIG